MQSPVTIFLIASEEAFSIYQSAGAKDLKRIAHRTAASLGDVTHPFAAEKAHGHTGHGGPSFTVGDQASRGEDLERASLARHAVEALDRVWAAAKADRIVIAAGPKLLGALRDAMPKGLGAHVAEELHKDLMNLPEQELAAHLLGRGV